MYGQNLGYVKKKKIEKPGTNLLWVSNTFQKLDSCWNLLFYFCSSFAGT